MRIKLSVVSSQLSGSRFWPSLNRGQSLFEVLFAVAIASIILVGVVTLSTKSIRNSDFSQNNTLATKYVQEGLEWIRQYRDADWVEFKSHSGPGDGTPVVWCINTLPYPPPTWGLPNSCGTGTISGTIFLRQLTMWRNDSVNPNVIEASVEVTWNDTQGEHTVNSQTVLTDWNR